MKKINNICLILFLLMAISWSHQGFAQEVNFKKNRWGFVAGAGLATYQGELANSFSELAPKPNLVFGLNYRLSSRLSLQSDLNLFKLGAKLIEHNKYASFESNNIELGVNMVYDLIAMKNSYFYRPSYTPYLFAGLGILGFSSKSGRMSNADMVSSGKDFSTVIPFGVGVKIKVANYLDFAIETGIRKTFSDKLDNSWNGASINSSSLQNLAYNQADSKILMAETDQYFFTQVKLIYSPSKSSKKKIKSISGYSKSELRKIKQVSNDISRSMKLMY